RALCLVALLGLLAGPAASEEELSAEDAKEIARADALVDRVVELYMEARYEEAVPLAREALAIAERIYAEDDARLAYYLFNTASPVSAAGDFKTARPLLDRALALLEAEEVKDELLISSVLNDLATGLQRTGNAQAALPLAQRALALREKLLEPHDRRVVQLVNNLGTVFRAVGQLKPALAHFERALLGYQKDPGPESFSFALTLNNISTVKRELGDAKGALGAAELSLALYEKLGSGDHPAAARVLVNRGLALRDRGRLDEALRDMKRAVSIYTESYGPDHEQTGESHHNLAVVLQSRGDYEGAREAFETSLAVLNKTIGASHPRSAMTLAQLGFVLVALGDTGAAEGIFRRALARCKEALPAGHPWIGHIAMVLGNLLASQGKVQEARLLCESALQTFESAYGRPHSLIRQCLAILGGMLRGLGDYEGSRAYLERAVEVSTVVHGPEAPNTAAAIVELGSTILRQGDLATALATYRRAQTIFTKRNTSGALNWAEATCAHNIAFVLRDLGDLEGAHENAERAVSLFEQAVGTEHLELASALDTLGAILGRLDRPADAKPHLERALAIREKLLGREHLTTAYSLNNLADHQFTAGAYADSRRLSEEALDIILRSARKSATGLEEARRVGLAAHMRQAIYNWVAFSREWPEAAYGPVLRMKGLAARITIEERRVARRAPESLREQIDRLRTLNQRIARLGEAVPTNARLRKQWRTRYADVSKERDLLALELAHDLAAQRGATDDADLTLANLQARLGPHDAFVDTLRVKEHYVAWVVRKTGPAVQIDLGPRQPIRSLIERLQYSLRTGASGERGGRAPRGSEKPASWEQVAQRLGDAVLGPLVPHLGKDVERLILCPDGILASVPFALLPGRKEGARLIDEVEIEWVALASDLIGPEAEFSAKANAPSFLLGAVDYDHAAAKSAAAAPAAKRSSAPGGAGPFEPLPGTAAEVAALRKRLGKGVVVRTGADATERSLREHTAKARIVHLATHGFVRSDLRSALEPAAEEMATLNASQRRQLSGWDPMLLAGLALSGANDRKGGHGDDGILTAQEASYLDLDACELVVLSACDTARGEVISGEGVRGLVFGFRMSGAQQIVASLWPVDDEATQLLMGRFYERYLDAKAPVSAAEALRAASIWLRDEAVGKGGRRFAHPRYWAAFVAYGN
nr:CHAT domain-containing protein [Planctomycetota bacterium]